MRDGRETPSKTDGRAVAPAPPGRHAVAMVPWDPRPSICGSRGKAVPEVGEHSEFLSAFLRAPVSTGSVVPSSRALAERMIEGIDLGRAKTIVEAGPGTGAFTGAILEAACPEARVLAVELNAQFAARLGHRYSRLRVVRGSVENLPGILGEAGLPLADAVLCGLPWALLRSDRQRACLGGIAGGLREGGVFVTFGYVHCAVLPRTLSFRRQLALDFSDLDRSPIVWRNFPPAIVYRWIRRQKRY